MSTTLLWIINRLNTATLIDKTMSSVTTNLFIKVVFKRLFQTTLACSYLFKTWFVHLKHNSLTQQKFQLYVPFSFYVKMSHCMAAPFGTLSYIYIYIYSISNAYPLRRWWPSWHWDLKIKQSMSKLQPANEKKRKTKNFTNTQKTNAQSTHIQFQRVKCDTDTSDRLSVSLFSFNILSCDIEKCVKGDPRFSLLTV